MTEYKIYIIQTTTNNNKLYIISYSEHKNARNATNFPNNPIWLTLTKNK